MRVLLSNNNDMAKMEIYHHQDSGDAQAAIYHRMTCQIIMRVGVGKKLIRSPFRVFLPTPADRHAASLEPPGNALILASYSVMLDHVLLVRTLVQPCPAFVEKRSSPDDVLILIMITVGVAGRFVATSCPVANIPVSVDVMKAFVAAVRF
jgi:hypothetical protein